MRWFIYLPFYLLMQTLVYAITWALPAFAVMQFGPIDNANDWATEPRLPWWLDDCNTYDNSLWGDNNWKKGRDASAYFAMVAWLYRNSYYTGKLKRFGMRIETDRQITGNPAVDYHTKTFGSLTIRQANGAWQYKAVKHFMGRILVLNFGWLLDDANQRTALFMFSPRLKKG